MPIGPRLMPGLLVDRYLKKFSKFFKPELKPIDITSIENEEVNKPNNKPNPDNQRQTGVDRDLNDRHPDKKE